MKLTLEILSPVTIASNHAAFNEIYTLDYIPGTVIRGALAYTYIKEHKLTDPLRDANFKEMFLSGKCVFGNLYLANTKLVPLSAFSCKYEPGFAPDGHGVQDMVIPLIKGEIGALEYCPQCCAPLDSFKGFYAKERKLFKKVEVQKRLIVRTAINPVRETAKQGYLFSTEVINEGSYFSGNLSIANGVKDRVTQFLNQERRLRIGLARTRGQGECKVASLQDDGQDELAERLARFNRCIRDKATYLSVMLLSDMLLFDNYLRFKSRLAIDDLLDCFPSSSMLAQFELLHSIASTRKISGWNYAPKVSLPKEDAVAIQKGSVFVFKSKEILSDGNKEKVINELKALPEFIGERTVEGFGQVRICDDFHTNFYQEPTNA